MSKWEFINKEQEENFYYSETSILLKKNISEWDKYLMEKY